MSQAKNGRVTKLAPCTFTIYLYLYLYLYTYPYEYHSA